MWFGSDYGMAFGRFSNRGEVLPPSDSRRHRIGSGHYCTQSILLSTGYLIRLDRPCMEGLAPGLAACISYSTPFGYLGSVSSPCMKQKLVLATGLRRRASMGIRASADESRLLIAPRQGTRCEMAPATPDARECTSPMCVPDQVAQEEAGPGDMLVGSKAPIID